MSHEPEIYSILSQGRSNRNVQYFRQQVVCPSCIATRASHPSCPRATPHSSHAYDGKQVRQHLDLTEEPCIRPQDRQYMRVCHDIGSRPAAEVAKQGSSGSNSAASILQTSSVLSCACICHCGASLRGVATMGVVCAWDSEQMARWIVAGPPIANALNAPCFRRRGHRANGGYHEYCRRGHDGPIFLNAD
jgi:hypothetical protein